MSYHVEGELEKEKKINKEKLLLIIKTKCNNLELKSQGGSGFKNVKSKDSKYCKLSFTFHKLKLSIVGQTSARHHTSAVTRKVQTERCC